MPRWRIAFLLVPLTILGLSWSGAAPAQTQTAFAAQAAEQTPTVPQLPPTNYCDMPAEMTLSQGATPGQVRWARVTASDGKRLQGELLAPKLTS